MNVALVAVPIMDWADEALIPIAMDARRECPPYGPYLLAGVLRAAGHNVRIIDLIAEGKAEVDSHAAALEQAELVGISSTSMSWPAALRVIKRIRKIRPDVPIVVGGIHGTLFDSYVLQSCPVDFVVRGEGERALLALCDELSTGRRRFDSVPNLSYKRSGGEIAKTPAAEKIPTAALGEVPIADYDQLPSGVYQGLSIESSRGCSFDCSFCSTQYRKTWRPIAAEAFVDRLSRTMEYLPRTIGGYMHVIDDEFAMNPRRVIEIGGILDARGMRPQLVFDARAHDVTFENFVPSIKDHTLAFLIGAECGYDEGLERIGKGTTTALLERAARVLADAGIANRADFSFIIGLPWETATEVRRTIKFAGHLHSTYGVTVLLQWYYQIPGSRLWEQARLEQKVSEAMYDDFGFFTRNLYLFRGANRLSPSEIEDISREVREMIAIASLGRINKSRSSLAAGKNIEYRHPEVMSHYFPAALIGSTDNGLKNLRELARPGHPERTMSTARLNRGFAATDHPTAPSAQSADLLS